MRTHLLCENDYAKSTNNVHTGTQGSSTHLLAGCAVLDAVLVPSLVLVLLLLLRLLVPRRPPVSGLSTTLAIILRVCTIVCPSSTVSHGLQGNNVGGGGKSKGRWGRGWGGGGVGRDVNNNHTHTL
jgi:hypothetical protein